MTTEQALSIHLRALQLHAALHDVNESVAQQFADATGLSNRDLSDAQCAQAIVDAIVDFLP